MLRTYKKLFGLLAFAAAGFFKPCLGFVFSIAEFIHPEKEQTIFVCADHHAYGTYSTNQEQLEYFVKKVLTQMPCLLLPESQFFYGLNLSDSFDSNMDAIGTKIQNISNLSTMPLLSFDNSPQNKTHTTWIGWHLPVLLSQIKNNIPLPSSFQGLLSAHEQTIIQSNASIECLDPRMDILDTTNNVEDQKEIIEALFNDYFNNALKNCSEKEFFSALVDRTAKNSAQGEALLFDLNTIDTILKHPGSNTIIVLCGYWHALFLNNALEFFGFKKGRNPTGLTYETVNKFFKDPAAPGTPPSKHLGNIFSYITNNRVTLEGKEPSSENIPRPSVKRALFFNDDVF